MKRRFIAVLAAASVLGLSACGSGSPSSTGGTATGGAGGDSGLTKVSVGVIPIVDCAPIYLGDKQGFFKEEGLQLDIQTATGGAAIVPGVVSGSFDFAFSNLISVMVAKDKGLDLKFVANGASTTGEIGKDIGGVVVPAGSSIQSAEGPRRQDRLGEQPLQHRRHHDQVRHRKGRRRPQQREVR